MVNTTVRLIMKDGSTRDVRVADRTAQLATLIMPGGKKPLTAVIGALGAEMATGKPRRFVFRNTAGDTRVFVEV